MNQSPRSSNNQVSQSCPCHPFQGPNASAVCCHTKYLREGSSQLSIMGPLLSGMALFCSLPYTPGKKLPRLRASFSLLHVDLPFHVLTSCVSSQTLPLISSSLLSWLACTGSRVSCSQQTNDHSGTGLLGCITSVDSTSLSGRKHAQQSCALLKLPLDPCASFI